MRFVTVISFLNQVELVSTSFSEKEPVTLTASFPNGLLTLIGAFILSRVRHVASDHPRLLFPLH